MKLKEVYPLYLNNQAVQPNADLAVTDKFTGEVAFRTALATLGAVEQFSKVAMRPGKPLLKRLDAAFGGPITNPCLGSAGCPVAA